MRQAKILHSASHFANLNDLRRLPLAPAGSWLFPTLSPQVFPQVPGPLSRWVPMVHLPVSSHRNIGLPQANTGSAFPHRSVQRLQYGSAFETAVIPLCSGPQVCSPLRSLPPQSISNRSGCDFYVRASHDSLPHRAPGILVVRTGQLTTGDSHPLKLAALSAAPFACARLSDPQLIPSGGTFSSTLTSMAFDHSSLRCFEACSCKPTPRDLPSSPVQPRGTLSPTNRYFWNPKKPAIFDLNHNS